MPPTTHDPSDRIVEVLFEITTIGGSVRVAAIEPRSNVEVVVFGPVGQGLEALKRIAVRKLQRRCNWHQDGRTR